MRLSGPQQDPWGTSWLMGNLLERPPLTDTRWNRSDRYDLNQASASSVTPQSDSRRWISLLWCIVPNATLKSNKHSRVWHVADPLTSECHSLLQVKLFPCCVEVCMQIAAGNGPWRLSYTKWTDRHLICPFWELAYRQDWSLDGGGYSWQAEGCKSFAAFLKVCFKTRVYLSCVILRF